MNKMMTGLLVSVLTVGLAACADMSGQNKGVAIGAGAGAVGGAVIGNQMGSGGGAIGALVGAIAGATAGGVYGNQVDKNDKQAQQINQQNQKINEQSQALDQNVQRISRLEEEARHRSQKENGAPISWRDPGSSAQGTVQESQNIPSSGCRTTIFQSIYKPANGPETITKTETTDCTSNTDRQKR